MGAKKETERGVSALALLAVTTIFLVFSEVCECGSTSAYIRNKDLGKDMPLDSDVFAEPPGYNAPQQVNIILSSRTYRYIGCFTECTGYLWKVHITQGDHEGKGVIVSWVTPDEPGLSAVLYWPENRIELRRIARGIVRTYKYYNYTSGYIHHCNIKDLEVSQTRSYRHI